MKARAEVRFGVARIELQYFNNLDVADKHRQLEGLCKDLRKRFNLSALEVDAFDDPEICVLALAAAIPENWTQMAAETFVQKICQIADETAFARVVRTTWDILTLGS